jgi:hypothetical protein
MDNLETKATLGYDRVQRQTNEKQKHKINMENWKVYLSIQSITKLTK